MKAHRLFIRKAREAHQAWLNSLPDVLPVKEYPLARMFPRAVEPGQVYAWKPIMQIQGEE